MVRDFVDRRQGRYGHVALSLHWLIAALIAGGFALGWTMTDIPGITPTKLRYFSWHKWIGCTVFVFAIVRLLWRAGHPPPPIPETTPSWQRHAAHWAHIALYGLMLLIPVSGYLYSSAAGIQVIYLGVLPLPTLIDPDPELKGLLRLAHVALNYALLGLVFLHVVAALKHQLVDRDGLLSRMLPRIPPRTDRTR